MPNNPELMSQLMNSPIMQNMMNDPELMRNMLAQNPMVSQVCILPGSYIASGHLVDFGDPHGPPTCP